MRIARYRKSENTGSLVGYVSVEFMIRFGDNFEYEAPFCLNDLKFFNKDGRQWVSPADRKYQAQDGQEKYAPYYGIFDREKNENFQKEVLKALAIFLREGATTTPPASQNANSGSVNGQKTQMLYPHVNAQVQQQPKDEELPF